MSLFGRLPFSVALWLAFSLVVSKSTLLAQEKARDWLRRAEAACKKIEDPTSADRAFARLHDAYIECGEIASAEAITSKIKDGRQRGSAHIAVARYYAEAGEAERCQHELDRVKPLTMDSRLRRELMEAYLELAESPPLAIELILHGPHTDPRAREDLCDALTRFGYLDDALKVAAQEEGAERRLTLQLKIAFAAAKAGRAADTEKVLKLVAMNGGSEKRQQSVWAELAEALYKKKDLESARKYAARVTAKYLIRTKRALRRIADGVPPNAPYLRTYSRKRTNAPLTVPLPTEDPQEAERLLERVIARAEGSPIESSSGQFGPWNQKAEMARIRMQYAIVAALYRKAGDQDKADMKMQLAVEAIQTVIKENSFAAMLAINELQQAQLSLSDYQGLKQSMATADPSLWMWAADAAVSKVLESGDVDGAKKLAKQALASKPMFGGPHRGKDSTLITCFLEAGEDEAALEIVKASKLLEPTALACEHAGRLMVRSDREQLLLSPKWQTEIGPFQLAHLSIGAALEAKKGQAK